MAKLYEKDLSESTIQYSLPESDFVFQAVSKRAGVRVRRFDGQTHLDNPQLTAGKPYEEIFQLIQINEEAPSVYRLNYSFTGAIYQFLKERKEAEESTELSDYRLVIGVTKTENEETGFFDYEYTVKKHKKAKQLMDIQAANAKLLDEVESLEEMYARNTEAALASPASEKKEEPAKKTVKASKPAAKKPVEPAEEADDDMDTDDLPF